METEEVYERDMEPIEIAMHIILHAGDARNLIFRAGELMKDFQFKEAQQLMEEAEHELNLAHVSQTDYVQREARGEVIAYSILFAHAQDTLMTIVSEHNMMKQMMVMVMKLLDIINRKQEE